MEVSLLGTGSADGWPNPFCRCLSCTAQQHLLRTPTSLLIDGRLLVDCGPETPRQGLRLGANLADVEAVLISHSHPDHCAPEFLLHRSWVSSEPLQVVGPEPVVRACQPWLAPDQQSVRLQKVTVGDEVDVAGYRVLALPAAHWADGEALLYRIMDSSGTAVLYGTDTGELPDGFEEALGSNHISAVFLEQTFGDAAISSAHHDFSTFARSLDRLRAMGNVDATTQVIAIHLSHYNPIEAELVARLATMGARPGMDGQIIRIGVH